MQQYKWYNDKQNDMKDLLDAARSADLTIYSEDFLCKTLAIILVFGSEDFTIVSEKCHGIALFAGDMMERAVNEKNTKIIKTFRKYCHDINNRCADWLPDVINRLGLDIRNAPYKYHYGDLGAEIANRGNI